MKYYLYLTLLFANMTYAFPVECPPVGSLYHGGAGTVWEVSPEFSSKGWFVSQNPEAINTNIEATLYSNPLEATISNVNASKTYYFSCIYKIGYPRQSVMVVLINRWPQRDPTANSGFKRVQDGVFLCDSTLAHANTCRNETANGATITPIAAPATQAAVNELVKAVVS